MPERADTTEAIDLLMFAPLLYSTINDFAFSLRSFAFLRVCAISSQSVFISVYPWLNFLPLFPPLPPFPPVRSDGRLQPLPQLLLLSLLLLDLPPPVFPGSLPPCS